MPNSQPALCAGEIARVTPVTPLWFHRKGPKQWSLIAATLNEDEDLTLGLFGPGDDEPLATRHYYFPMTPDILVATIREILDNEHDAKGARLDNDETNWAIVDQELGEVDKQLKDASRSRLNRLTFFSPYGDQGLVYSQVVMHESGLTKHHSRIYDRHGDQIESVVDQVQGESQTGRLIDTLLKREGSIFPFVAHHSLDDYGVDRTTTVSTQFPGTGVLAF